MWAQVCYIMCVEPRGKLLGADFLLPWDLHSGSEGRLLGKYFLATEPKRIPYALLFYMGVRVECVANTSPTETSLVQEFPDL